MPKLTKREREHLGLLSICARGLNMDWYGLPRRSFRRLVSDGLIGVRSAVMVGPVSQHITDAGREALKEADND